MQGETSSKRLLRVTLVVSELLEQRVISQATALGVAGYVCSYCSGKPLRAGIENSKAMHGLVRIELLVASELLEGLASLFEELQGQSPPVTAFLDPVQVFDEASLSELV